MYSKIKILQKITIPKKLRIDGGEIREYATMTLESIGYISKISYKAYFCGMRIGLVIADFESSYSTSFQHTARVKYGVDFNTSNIDAIRLKLNDLKAKYELNQHNNVHVGYEITLEDIVHVQNLLNQISEKYREVYQVLPPNMKIYTINQKLKETESPSASELAKQVLTEVLSPVKPDTLTKKEQIEADAKAISARRALDLIKKNSAKGN